MSATEQTLELTVTGTDEERGDRWAFTCNELGFTVYGHTREDAQKALADALTAFVNSFGDNSLLRTYLDSKGVKHRFALKGDRLQAQGWERSFEVLLGAAAD